MGFLKKKSVTTLGGEVSSTLAKMRPVSPTTSIRSRPSSPFVAKVVEEHRDDGGASLEIDVEDRSSAVATNNESGKASDESLKAKTKSVTSSNASSASASLSKSARTRPTSNKTIENGKPAPAAPQSKPPVKLGKKSKLASEKKEKKMPRSLP